MNIPFTSIVFSGGGGRCIWQAGFYEEASGGGLFDLDEIAAVSAGAFFGCLILLTRKYRPGSIPDIPGRTYIQPSERITLDKWDYTDPDGLAEVYELGRRDGRAFQTSRKETI